MGQHKSWIEVNGERVKSTGLEVFEDVETLSNDVQRMLEIVGSTYAYWHGLGGNVTREKLKNEHEKIAEVIARLKQYSPDLVTMAGIYMTYEDMAKEIAERQAADVELVKY